MVQHCPNCSRTHPADAVYCHYDGVPLKGGAAALASQAALTFPRPCVFPSGTSCKDYDELALACQENWADAVQLLKQGKFRQLFSNMGRVDLAMVAQVASEFPDPDRGLDSLLEQIPAKSLPSPKLKLVSNRINLGEIKLGADQTAQLPLQNAGKRLLHGNITSNSPWLVLGEAPGQRQKLFQFAAAGSVPLRVRTKFLRAGAQPIEARLLVDSNGGRETITVKALVPVTPFAEGLLAGASSPRELALKARTNPKEAAPYFEGGKVAAWYEANGWQYPVSKPYASGVGAVQQFFEALGLTKPPTVSISESSITLQSGNGVPIRKILFATAEKSRPVFAHARSNQPWLKTNVELSGSKAKITVEVPDLPNTTDEKLEARLLVTANGNQRFVVPVTLSLGVEIIALDESAIISDGPPPIPGLMPEVLPVDAPLVLEEVEILDEPEVLEEVLEVIEPPPIPTEPKKKTKSKPSTPVPPPKELKEFEASAPPSVPASPKKEKSAVPPPIPTDPKKKSKSKPSTPVPQTKKPDEVKAAAPSPVPATPKKIRSAIPPPPSEQEISESDSDAETVEPVEEIIAPRNRKPKKQKSSGGIFLLIGAGAAAILLLAAGVFLAIFLLGRGPATATPNTDKSNNQSADKTPPKKASKLQVAITDHGEVRIPGAPLPPVEYQIMDDPSVPAFVEKVKANITDVPVKGAKAGKLAMKLSGDYSPGQRFTVAAIINDPDSGEKVTLQLPPGLQLVKGDVTQSCGLFVKKQHSFSWTARVADLGKHLVRVKSSGGKAVAQMLEISRIGDGSGKMKLTIEGDFNPGKNFKVIAAVGKPLKDQTLNLQLGGNLKLISGKPIAAAAAFPTIWEVQVQSPGRHFLEVRSSTGQRTKKIITVSQPTAGRFLFTLSGTAGIGQKFDVKAVVANPVPNQHLKLVLPPGLTLAQGDAQQLVPGSGAVTWNVRLERLGTFAIRVESSTGFARMKTMRISGSNDSDPVQIVDN